MRPKFQSSQSVSINATLEKVWTYGLDLSRIPTYHPRVNKVELVSGKQFREEGVAYQCHLADGKNTCVEKDIEIVPMEKVVTIFLSDTMGLTKLLPDYVVETTLQKISDGETQLKIAHYYSSSKLKVRLINFIIKRKIAGETQDMLNGLKKAIENDI